MVYNPTLAKKKNNSRPRRQPNPHAGTKHSDIIRKDGIGTLAPSGESVKSSHGFTTEIFKGKNFVQRYECYYAGNATGFGVNRKGDKTVRVLKGTLFATVAKLNNKNELITPKEIVRVNADGTISLPRGLGYSLATTGTEDAEFLVTETVNYENAWVELEESTETALSDSLLMPATQRETVVARRDPAQSKAHQQAVNMATTRNRQRGANAAANRPDPNANSSSVAGLNPRPSGPPPQD